VALSAEHASALGQTGLFEALSEEELARLACSSARVEVSAGTLIVKRGSSGEALYVVLDGAVQVAIRSESGRRVVLARLEAGDYFGEQALLPGRGGRRNANVRAVADSSLLRVSRADFRQALERSADLTRRLRELGAEQDREALLSSSPFFAALKDGGAGTRVTRHAKGEEIVRQGEPGLEFFVVLDGTAAVWREQHGERQLCAALGPGQCFGALALLHAAPRAAPVVAEEELELLCVQAERFRELVVEQPGLARLFETLGHVYHLPRRGLVTRHVESFLGRDAITTLHHLDDGRRVRSTRVVDGELFHALVAGDTSEGRSESLRWRDPDAALGRSLLHAGGALLELSVEGPWDELGSVFARMLDRELLDASELARFAATGDLAPPAIAPRRDEPAPAQELDPLVCHCMEVRLSALEEALARGHDSPDCLSEETGAGSACGSCFGELIELAGNASWDAMELVAIDELATGLLRLELAPRPGQALEPALAGQHVLLQALIDGAWVQRPYTLISPAGETRVRELVMRCEGGGALSSWMAEHGRVGLRLRCSPPRGRFTFDPRAEAPALFFAGGVGITPGLAFARTLASSGAQARTLHLDWSARSAAELFCRDELNALAESVPNFRCELRATQESGRLASSRVREAIERAPDAELFLCGPAPYQATLFAHLDELGIEQGRVRVEQFTPQGSSG